MRTLLIALDKPIDDQLTAIIGDTVPGYALGSFMLDFARINMYQAGPAPQGDVRRRDRDTARQMVAMIDCFGIDDVVLIGVRVRQAFDKILGAEPDFLQSRVIDNHGTPLRFWSLPHPSGRNYWYNDPLNRASASRLLATLRARQHIPHHEETT